MGYCFFFSKNPFIRIIIIHNKMHAFGEFFFFDIFNFNCRKHRKAKKKFIYKLANNSFIHSIIYIDMNDGPVCLFNTSVALWNFWNAIHIHLVCWYIYLWLWSVNFLFFQQTTTKKIANLDHRFIDFRS